MSDELLEEFGEAVTAFDDACDTASKMGLTSPEIDDIVVAANTAIEKAQRIIYGE